MTEEVLLYVNGEIRAIPKDPWCSAEILEPRTVIFEARNMVWLQIDKEDILYDIYAYN